MRLIITRHGETEENKAGIMQGHLPGVLSELGREQAGKLAERLKDEKIDLIVSSDLARALDTAKIIAKFHPDVELVLDERLRERFLGEFQGKLTADVDWDNPPEDFETREEMEKRVFELFEEVLEKNSAKTVLFVGHSGINKALLHRLLKMEDENASRFKVQNNTCVNIFDVDKSGKVETRLLNCVRHLG